MRKLTQQEEEKLNSFIGKCVRGNVQLGVLSNKIGANITMDIQEVYNSNINTLLTFGQKLERLEKDNGGRFSTKTPYLVGGVVPITEMMDIIELIVVEKQYSAYIAKETRAIEKLQQELDGMKTESEIRADKTAELARRQAAFKQEVGEA